ncbi:amidase [Jiella mangrovi]|uniref:Amidase n=1 Tax=Jiella mangrovi TaxID=2821407 RepID=A0ABS4BLE5_9HYPH|nr:amidase [Jiella mangrovi]
MVDRAPSLTGAGANWLTASEAASQIKAGDLTCESLVTACLDRWRARNDEVRAWTHLDPEQVLSAARACDDAGGAGPLRGIPIGVKDIITTHDMPTRFNSPHFQDHFPNIDAASVATLRLAGAVMMGKCDTVEFAINGRRAATRNPYDPSRTPGGSSSGSAAAVADGQVPIALGTQTGGSVIRPASYCGVYAIKPTWNAVSAEGFKVCSASIDTLGWYARSAEDLDLVAEVFAIHDDETPAYESLSGMRFGFCQTPVWDQAEAETRAAMARLADLLREAGATIVELELPPEFAGLASAHKVVMQAEMRSAFLAESRRLGNALYPEMVGILANKDGHRRADLVAAQDLAASCRKSFDALAAGFDAVVTPSTAGVAPKGPDDTGAATFNRMWTLLHTPCVNVPGFCGPQGLPLGLTLTGPRFHDRHLIAAAGLVGELVAARAEA